MFDVTVKNMEVKHLSGDALGCVGSWVFCPVFARHVTNAANVSVLLTTALQPHLHHTISVSACV